MKHNYINKNAKKERQLDKIAKHADKPCGKKKWFYHKQIAEQAARKEMEKALIPLYVYKCPFCKNYHLTSSAPRR